MINYNSMLVVISGPSGVGKGTICNSLIKSKLNNMELSVSATTRKPRNGETEGVNYYFKEKNEFEKMIKKNEFLEYAEVYGNYYGTIKRHVLSKMEKGISVILEIDTYGASLVKENFDEGVFIFIMPPSFSELRKRIENRGTETKKDIEKRLKSAYEEIYEVKNYDYTIINDDIDKATDRIISILKAEKYKTSRCKIDFPKLKEEFYD